MSWRQSPSYPIYEISDTSKRLGKGRIGQVRNKKTKKILKNCLIKSDSYYRVMVYKDGKGTVERIHSLVAEAFLRVPKRGEVVNHKDGRKLNNTLRNLEIITVGENNVHAIKLRKKRNDKKPFKIPRREEPSG